jgi:uncharacterized protein (DUF488 family)
MMAGQQQLFTAGYSGHDVVSFVRALQSHCVRVVVDVRQNPVSRKKGFSRRKLSEFLAANGLEYRHEPRLGVPSDLRKRLRSGVFSLKSYFKDFRARLGRETDALDQLYRLASEKRCCLICLEARPEECHRSVVAQEVASRNGHTLEIVHL